MIGLGVPSQQVTFEQMRLGNGALNSRLGFDDRSTKCHRSIVPSPINIAV